MKKNVPQKLGKIIETVFAKHGYYKHFIEMKIITDWHLIVGDRIAEVTKCTDIRDGVVFVSVRNSSWRQELSYIKKEILSKIYNETQCTSVKDIHFY
ncbi:MAG: DUF721 domain-containing protein [Chitinispirillia bacterium]|jgi:predicted nucleic acid-binding Zn ribbon protein